MLSILLLVAINNLIATNFIFNLKNKIFRTHKTLLSL